MLTLIASNDMVQCSGCAAMVQDVTTGVPEGWDGLFCAGEWSFLCPGCRMPLDAPVFAVLRPRSLDGRGGGEVALFVGVGSETRVCALGLGEARRLHATIGQALALADNIGGLA